MNTLLPNPYLADDSNPQHIATQWINAVNEFHNSYYQLVAYLKSTRSNQPVKTTRGQCPTRQVIKLVTAMHRELNALVNDSEGANQLKKLKSHTSRLNDLNRQAKSSLYLVGLSAS